MTTTHPAFLEPLVGSWTIHASINGTPTGDGTTTFEWMPGTGLLVQRSESTPDASTPPEWIEHSPFPIDAVIGADDTTGEATMLYSDARGVLRIYDVSLENGVWKIWRSASGMHQRFTGTFSADGRTIESVWEGSPDGLTWTHDFETRYERVG